MECGAPGLLPRRAVDGCRCEAFGHASLSPAAGID